MSRVCTNPNCQREIFTPAELCPYCRGVVKDNAPELPLKPLPTTVVPSPQKPAKSVAKNPAAVIPPVPASPSKGAAPRKIPVKLDRHFIRKNTWASLLVGVAAGVLFILPDMTCRAWAGRSFSLNWRDVLLASVGGFMVIQLVRWRQATRPDSRLVTWFQNNLWETTCMAVSLGFLIASLGMVFKGLAEKEWEFVDFPVWFSSGAWFAAVCYWGTKLFSNQSPAKAEVKADEAGLAIPDRLAGPDQGHSD
jgi:hypothetical protein